MTKKLDTNHQRKHNKRIFPNRRRKAKNEIQPHTKLQGNCNGTRKTKAYLHRFKIIEDPTCTCGKAVQTTDHLIFECETLTKERKKRKTTALPKKLANQQRRINKEVL